MRVLLASLLLASTVACSKDQTITGTTGPSGPFTITGTVRDSSGAGVIDATVTIASGPNAGSTTKTVSNPAGAYTFIGLQASSLIIKVTSSQWAPAQVVMTLPGDLVADVVMKYPQFILTGHVFNADTSAPVPNVYVSVNGRYDARSDSAGRYHLTGALDGGNLGTLNNVTFATVDGFEPEYRPIQANVQDFHLRPFQRITAGASTSITVSPTDTMCVNNVQDTPQLYGSVFFMVCRSVRVTAPKDGLLTVEAVSSDGAHPQLEAEAVPDAHCCTLENMANPWSQFVTAGTEVIVNVEIPSNSGGSKTFTVQTTLSAGAAQARRH
jgi:protocatechuate 3,4-dioxygenase beta subunit